MTAIMMLSSTVDLSYLSSNLLSKVTHYLNTKELCEFDTAVVNRHLRIKYQLSLSNTTFLFGGNVFAVDDYRGSEVQEMYVRWLLKRNVFLKSIFLNSVTNTTTVELYGRLPGVQVLVLDGCIDFSIDLAVRRVQTLHKLVLIRQGMTLSCRRRGQKKYNTCYTHGRKRLQILLMFIRSWHREGGVLKKLICTECQFYDLS
jgi:hypothetical protein